MTVERNDTRGDAPTMTIDWREYPPSSVQNAVVAVGNFDGVHLGHAALLKAARELTKAAEPVTAITFDPHPLQLLAPERFLPPLTSIADRAEQLHQVGVDAVVILKTTPELLELSPDDFFRQILLEHFRAKGIVEGFNFRFGRDRAGSVETLRTLCERANILFRVVEPFSRAGVIVSSSRVRDALMSGDVIAAAELMNRPYHISGTVFTGAKRGRTIGFPTANLDGVETLLPAEGVYAVRVEIGKARHFGAANIGPNPTFGENARKIEVHLIDFEGDLYGQSLAVEFMQRLRETRKFNSADELIGQLRRDVERVRALMREIECPLKS